MSTKIFEWVNQYLGERVRDEGDPPEPMRWSTKAQLIEKHFQQLGFPFVFGSPESQLLGCGGNGCTFLVGPQLVLKISANTRFEKAAFVVLSGAGLIGHPGLAIITPAGEAFWDKNEKSHRGEVFAYLLHEVAPFDKVQATLDRQTQLYLERGVQELRTAATDITFGATPTEDDPTQPIGVDYILRGLERIYTLGKDPFFGPLADLLLQAAMDDYAIHVDLGVKNLGFPIDEYGNPIFEQGLVAYDLHGMKIDRVEGLGIYADYVFDEEEGIFQ